MSPLIEINDFNWQDHVDGYLPDGTMRAKGLIPRDWDALPHGAVDGATPFPDELLIPESDWDAWIAYEEARQNSLQHVRDRGMNGQQIPSLDQDGVGYCWIHDPTNAMKLLRAKMGLPYVPLSAFMAGCIIKGYRDQGGNAIDGIQFFAEKGICSEAFWPAQSMSRANDKPEMWANAALHKCQNWWECSDDPRKRRLQVASALLRKWPVCGDFNWWGHSVVMVRLLSHTDTLIWNSWGDGWSQKGMGKLSGSKAWPDNATIPYVEMASAA